MAGDEPVTATTDASEDVDTVAPAADDKVVTTPVQSEPWPGGTIGTWLPMAIRPKDNQNKRKLARQT